MDNTIKVRRANVELDISPDEKQMYMERGYSVVDDNGNVIEEALSNDVNALRVQVNDLKAQLAAANKTIAELREAKKSSKGKKSDE